MKNNFRKTLVLGAAVLGFGILPAQADTTLATKLRVKFLGFNVGKLVSTVSVGASNYNVVGLIKTSGVGKMVSKTTAEFASSGKLSGVRAVPTAHNLSFQTKKRSGSLKMAFSGGKLSKTTVVPAVKYKPGAVRVTKAHLQSVIDPVSSLVFPVAANQVGNGNAVCNRTLPIFDGKTRMDLVFRYKGKVRVKAKGFKGTAYRCSVRYRPISGIRPFKKNVKFMKANRDMEVTMARVGKTNVYSLFGFKVKTDKGTASGSATTFQLN